VLLILYELPILILAVAGTIQFTMRGFSLSKLLSRIRKREPDFSGIVERSLEGIRNPQTGRKREEFMRFSIIWMIATLAIYAYIGEKVPWLVVHQLLPVIFVSTYLMSTRKTLFAVLSAVFLVLVLWHVAFVPADVNEPIVQVQNSEDLRSVMALIDASNRTVISSTNYWPLPWYYRGEKAQKIQYYGYLLPENTLVSTKADLIITYDAESYPSLPGYTKQNYKINFWFSYYDSQDRLLEYYFLRNGKLGSMNFDLFTRTDLVAGVEVPEAASSPPYTPFSAGGETFRLTPYLNEGILSQFLASNEAGRFDCSIQEFRPALPSCTIPGIGEVS
jgi:hypothetical protein